MRAPSDAGSDSSNTTWNGVGPMYAAAASATASRSRKRSKTGYENVSLLAASARGAREPGSGRRTIALNCEKKYVQTPMPTASDATPIAVTPGCFRSIRRP